MFLLDQIAILRDRAQMLSQARNFFAMRGVIEVDTPILSPYASVDAHIDLIPALFNDKQQLYMHSSPEYGMKRLLADGSGDIYQLSHVFRDNEFGHRHRPEFMMAEWYRLGYSYQEMIDETLDFMTLFVGEKERHSVSYREALLCYADIDYVTASTQELACCLVDHGIEHSSADTDREALLNVILGCIVEPAFTGDVLYVLTDYPADQAALAQTHWRGDERVAERFEVYCEGLELANGYHELADAEEQERRLRAANQQRLQLGKKSLPIDESFLEALLRGLPDCCGVAVGFDRLMMLRHRASHIEQVVY
jgi:lysyl-tRNA synthetase class 2